MTNPFLFITKGNRIQLVSDTHKPEVTVSVSSPNALQSEMEGGCVSVLEISWACIGGDIETAQNKRNLYSLIHTKQRFICLFALSSGSVGDSSAGKRGPV